eukprot:5571022-Amphidinium_carterae.2
MEDQDVKRLPTELAAQVVKTVKILDKVIIPVAKQRTNVWDPPKPSLRSVNLGAFTTRVCVGEKLRACVL